MNKRVKKIMKLSLIGLIVLAISLRVCRIAPISWNLHTKTYTEVFSYKAIKGYDPVSYLIEQKAVMGQELYTYKWNNATWNFASKYNKNLFVSDPNKYAPQYGGYCALAISHGITSFINPESFEILDEKVYLFANELAHENWKKYKSENIKKSDAKWE